MGSTCCETLDEASSFSLRNSPNDEAQIWTLEEAATVGGIRSDLCLITLELLGTCLTQNLFCLPKAPQSASAEEHSDPWQGPPLSGSTSELPASQSQSLGTSQVNYRNQFWKSLSKVFLAHVDFDMPQIITHQFNMSKFSEIRRSTLPTRLALERKTIQDLPGVQHWN